MTGGSSGYVSQHSIFKEYILFSYGVCKKWLKQKQNDRRKFRIITTEQIEIARSANAQIDM